MYCVIFNCLYKASKKNSVAVIKLFELHVACIDQNAIPYVSLKFQHFHQSLFSSISIFSSKKMVHKEHPERSRMLTSSKFREHEIFYHPLPRQPTIPPIHPPDSYQQPQLKVCLYFKCLFFCNKIICSISK